uniref:Uncharacterized protein LOC100176248 n=1 Tax=Phallusia mammillata TaxID=59560 RepID=A0A6F9DGG4_9ASCI|nr:uncharacterized protein LOC100176248 [Phallusia mammillata]
MESVLTKFDGSTFSDFLKAKPYNEDDMSCKLCSRIFKDLEAMKGHLQNHFRHCLFFKHNDQDVGAVSCSKLCGGKKRKRNHFHCPYCHQVFTRSTGIKGHMAAYKGECLNKPFKANVRLSDVADNLFMVTDSSMDFQSSLSSVDLSVTYFADKTFEEYFEQLSDHTNCPLCQFSSTKPGSFKNHLCHVHLNYSVCFIYNEINYCCLPCRKGCQGPIVNRFHRSHFHCPNCKNIFTRSASFKKHVASRIGKCALSTTINTTNGDEVLDQSDLEGKDPQIVSVFIDKGEFHVPQDGADENGIISAQSDSSEQEEDMRVTPAKRQRKSNFASPMISPQDTSVADEMFLKSLLPEMEMIPGERKFSLKMEIMRLIHDAAYKS